MSSDHNSFQHISVLSKELINSLNLNDGDLAVDCTTGGGGHSSLMLERISPSGQLLCLDQDADAIKHLEKKFAQELRNQTVILERTPFANLEDVTKKHNFFGKVSAVIADIGVSSHQIDTADRGFSFQKEGPLDMRMDQSNSLTAKEVINTYPEAELLKILYDYGQESHAKKIVNKISQVRKAQEITTTSELAELVKSSLPYKNSKKHPATKTFQALRIYINSELEQLKTMLMQAFNSLKPQGRLAIITFHSLEDRIVKEFFQELAGKGKKSSLPRDIPLTQSQLKDYNNIRGKIIRPFPCSPSDEEIRDNPRARSSRLRVIEKLD